MAAYACDRVGRLVFSVGRYSDESGFGAYPITDALGHSLLCAGVFWRNLLREASTQVPYTKAASLLACHSLTVKPTIMMGCMRRVSSLLCVEEDVALARLLCD